MSFNYAPSPGAEQDAHWATVFLPPSAMLTRKSTRDAGARVPIDFITRPGVYLTQACFPHGIYDDIPAQTCISDLLASQFGRVVIDLYWDNINRQFNLCPVELPPIAGNSTAGYSVDISALSSITATTSSPVVASVSPATAGLVGSVQKRQSTANNATSPITSSPNTSTATSAAPVPTTTGVSGTELLVLGPYKCSLDLNLDSIMDLYADYFDKTSNTVAAHIHYLTINLHAASPFTAPSEPADTPTQGRLPHGDNLVGAQFQDTLPLALYTPQELQSDRQNLNRSWFRDDFGMHTDNNYFTTSNQTGDGTITHNGWPGEEWILLTSHRRLLLNWGEIDPQMQAYDFQGDSDNVFQRGYLDSKQAVSVNNAGDVVSGCFYHPDDTKIGTVNSSWAFAVANDVSSSRERQHLAQNLTACGISPILNATLGMSAAQYNLDAWREFAQSAVFGWALGEPRNASQIKANDKRSSGPDIDYACAVIDSTSGYLGHWRVEQCQKQHRAACRIANEPYAWRLSTIEVPFESAPDACPDSTTFSLPRTGLENTYLYRKILNDTRSGSDDSILEGVWIDFNALDQADCWVIGGPNASCPYSGPQDSEEKRQVLIPTIAALIVLILTVLTLLVKCTENRRNSRTRRRGDDGWEYEGVPS
ncbi:Maintenance of telomere capping protein 6 [Exophiala xenobiotica]